MNIKQNLNKTDNKNIMAMGWVSYFTDMASSMTTPILPLFLVFILDEGVDKVGLVLAITGISSYLLRFAGGFLSDIFHKNKPLLIIGYGLSAICKPLMALVVNWQGVAITRSVERLGKAVRAAPKDKLITLSAKEGAEGRAFGLHKTLDVAGELTGLVVLLFVLVTLGSTEAAFRQVFWFTIIPGALALIVLIFYVKDLPGGQRKNKPLKFRLETSIKWPVLAYCAVSTFMFSEAFFLLQASSASYSMPVIIGLLLTMKLVQLLVSYRVGQLTDRMNSSSLLLVAFGLGAASVLSTLIPYAFSLVIAFILFGLHDVLMLNSIRTFISKNAVDKGIAFGMFYLLLALSTALGSVLIGFTWQYYGRIFATLLSAASVLSIAGIFWAFSGYLIKPETAKS